LRGSRPDKKPWPRRGGPPRARGKVRSARGGGADAARLERAAQLLRERASARRRPHPMSSARGRGSEDVPLHLELRRTARRLRVHEATRRKARARARAVRVEEAVEQREQLLARQAHLEPRALGEER